MVLNSLIGIMHMSHPHKDERSCKSKSHPCSGLHLVILYRIHKPVKNFALLLNEKALLLRVLQYIYLVFQTMTSICELIPHEYIDRAISWSIAAQGIGQFVGPVFQGLCSIHQIYPTITSPEHLA